MSLLQSHPQKGKNSSSTERNIPVPSSHIACRNKYDFCSVNTFSFPLYSSLKIWLCGDLSEQTARMCKNVHFLYFFSPGSLFGSGHAYHDEPLGQPGPGEEVDDPEPFGEAQVPEGRGLQGDGVGGGGPQGWLPLVALRAADGLGGGQAGFCWQPLVQVSELPGEKQESEKRRKTRWETPGHAPLAPGRGLPARPHLHAANVDGEHGGEEEHLQEEVGHQAHHGEEAELLQAAQTHRNQLRQLRDTGWRSQLHEKGSSAPCCPRAWA